MLNENVAGTLCLFGVIFTFLLPSGKENIGELSMEEVWREAGGFNGQRLEGSIPGNMNAEPLEKGGIPWVGKTLTPAQIDESHRSMEVQHQMLSPMQKISHQVV